MGHMYVLQEQFLSEFNSLRIYQTIWLSCHKNRKYTLPNTQKILQCKPAMKRSTTK